MITNTNISPYFDDYNPDKDFVKILFKPGYAVQARELTQLQTNIQAQIERFGNHIFQHGSMVIPGNSYTDNTVYYAKLTINTSPINLFTIGSIIIGGTNGVRAVVKFTVTNELSDPPTIYFSYISGGITATVPNGVNTFVLGESISLESNSSINATILGTSGSLGNGTLAYVGAGVYYVNGYFAVVDKQVIVIEKYSTVPSCRVGLYIQESIVTADTDETLLDPAQGSYNYAAPGADRLAVTLTLKKYAYSDVSLENYIELMRYYLGELEEHTRFPKYSELDKSLAKRTFEESGNYRVNGLNLYVQEHKKILRSEGKVPNNGYLTDGDVNKFVLGVTTGKAYINGFGIDKVGVTRGIFDKARDSASTLQKTGISVRPSYGTGLYVSDITGGVIDFNTRPSINLYEYGTTTIIGTANVYAIDHVYGSGTTRVFELSFYNLTLNSGIVLSNVGGFALTSNTAISGKVCQKLKITNPAVDFPANSVITYNSTIRNATVEIFDRSTLSLYVYRHSATLTPIRGDYIVSGTSNATVTDITTMSSNTNQTALIELPSSYIKSVKTAGNISDIKYYVWKHLAFITNGSGVGSVSVSAGEKVVSTEDGMFTALTSTGVLSNSLFSLNPAQTTISIASGPVSSNIIVSTIVEVTALQERTKTLTTTTYTTTIVGANQVISLPHKDIYRIASVILDPAGIALDITNYCVLDSGQKDYTYEIGKVTYLSTVATSTSVTVSYSYFSHSTGDYFSVDSYIATLGNDTYDYLSEYSSSSGETYDLKRCLDFRYSGTASGAPVSGYSITTSYQQFVGYYIISYLDNKNINFIKGIPSETPKVPRLPLGTLKIGTVYVPPYTNSLRNVKLTEERNYRYTMADISKIDNRVGILEYFSLLTAKEKGLIDFTIIDANTGLNRYKSGIVVEEFENQLISSDMTNKNNQVSYLATGITAPTTSNLNSVNVSSGGNNVIVVDSNKMMISYTEALWCGNSLSSSTENLNPYLVFDWEGELTINPSFDSFTNTVSLSGTNNMKLTNTITVNREETEVILNPAPPGRIIENVITVDVPSTPIVRLLESSPPQFDSIPLINNLFMQNNGFIAPEPVLVTNVSTINTSDRSFSQTTTTFSDGSGTVSTMSQIA